MNSNWRCLPLLGPSLHFVFATNLKAMIANGSAHMMTMHQAQCLYGRLGKLIRNTLNACIGAQDICPILYIRAVGPFSLDCCSVQQLQLKLNLRFSLVQLVFWSRMQFNWTV